MLNVPVLKWRLKSKSTSPDVSGILAASVNPILILFRPLYPCSLLFQGGWLLQHVDSCAHFSPLSPLRLPGILFLIFSSKTPM